MATTGTVPSVQKQSTYPTAAIGGYWRISSSAATRFIDCVIPSSTTPSRYEVTAAVCGTITFERRCYLQSYICLPARRHCSHDGDTPSDRGDPDPRWDRTLYRRPERNKPRPTHRGGHRDATYRRPGAPWGWRPLLGRVARRPRGGRDANGGRALRGPGFFAGPQREAGSYGRGGDDRGGWHRQEPCGSELFRVDLRARRAVAGRACFHPRGD